MHVSFHYAPCIHPHQIKGFFFSVQDREDKGPASIICIAKKKAYHTYIYQLVQKTR